MEIEKGRQKRSRNEDERFLRRRRYVSKGAGRKESVNEHYEETKTGIKTERKHKKSRYDSLHGRSQVPWLPQ